MFFNKINSIVQTIISRKMSNTIPHRIYDFLKEHPPFNFISKEELLKISQQIIIIYSESNDVFFKQGEKPPSFFLCC